MIRSLQAGRALAAIAVAAFHLSCDMALPRYGGTGVFAEFTRLGNRGVDFFFVLSGFIIILAHHADIDAPRAWGRYMYRRFVRLFPIYWLYTLGFVVLIAVVGSTDAKVPTNLADWLTTLSLVRFSAGEPPLPVAWTLFHELAFYGIFSVLILSQRAGMVALGVFVLAAAFFNQFPAEDARTAFHVYTASYNLYFLFGMCAFLLYRRGGSGLVETGIGLCLAILALKTIPSTNSLSPICFALALAILMAGIAKLEQSGRLRIPRVAVFIGSASYTIYLTHLALEGLLLKVAMKADLYPRVGHEAVYILVLAGTVSAGCLAYYFIERPLLKALRQRRTKPSEAEARPEQAPVPASPV